MLRSTLPLSVLTLLLIAPDASAQRVRSLPSGYTHYEGPTNNTIPFWATSGTYQQAHDDVDLIDANGGAPLIMLGMGFRKDGTTGTTSGRTMEVQITMGSSPLSSQTVTTDFASNLGPNPTVTFPYGPINIPSLTRQSAPNPIGFVIPFTAPYVFPVQQGNHLVWEMRHRNASSFASMAMDAVNLPNPTAVFATERGLGCQASGQVAPAAITIKTWDLITGDYRNQLERAPANAPALFLLGIEPTPVTLPGFCTAVEFLPNLTLGGVTNSAGTWNLLIQPGINFTGYPAITLMGQFLFFDQGLPNGIGFSDASLLTTPPQSGGRVARLYMAPYQGGPGNETATTATSVGRNYGLVVLFQLL